MRIILVFLFGLDWIYYCLDWQDWGWFLKCKGGIKSLFLKLVESRVSQGGVALGMRC